MYPFYWEKLDNAIFWKNNVLQDSLIERKRERKIGQNIKKTKPYILKDNKDYS